MFCTESKLQGTPNSISDVISMLRFPLAVFVVFIHIEGYYFHFDIGQPTYLITHFISNIISKVAVPTFFFISGFLFFMNVSKFDNNVYKKKIKSRISSLLVPYILWNTISFLIFLLSTHILGYNVFHRNIQLSSNIIKNLIKVYGYTYSWGWNNLLGLHISHYSPIDGPLWFIRDLMLFVVVTPIIYWLVKKIKWIIVLFLLVSMVLIEHPTLSGFFFFTLGCYFSISKIDPLRIYSENKFLLLIVLIVLVVPSFYIGSWIKQVFLVVYLFVLLGFCSCMNNKIVSCLINYSKYSFCIYCTHIVISLPAVEALLKLFVLPPIIYYFVIGIGTISLSIFIYKVLQPLNKYIKIV